VVVGNGSVMLNPWGHGFSEVVRSLAYAEGSEYG